MQCKKLLFFPCSVWWENCLKTEYKKKYLPTPLSILVLQWMKYDAFIACFHPHKNVKSVNRLGRKYLLPSPYFHGNTKNWIIWRGVYCCPWRSEVLSCSHCPMTTFLTEGESFSCCTIFLLWTSRDWWHCWRQSQCDFDHLRNIGILKWPMLADCRKLILTKTRKIGYNACWHAMNFLFVLYSRGIELG